MGRFKDAHHAWKKIFVGFTLCIAIINGTRLQLSNNYILDYCLFENSIIVMDITAVNVTGWVGIGFNNRTADMDGADFLIAGWESEEGWTYSGDYHVPIGSGNVLPTQDNSFDYLTVVASERNSTTHIHAERLLITGDTQGDVDIKNEPLYLIWAYNQFHDMVAYGHDVRGSLQFNLMEGSQCAEPTAGTTPSSTTPSPNECPATGNDLIEHPTSCSMYFVCLNGHAYEQECGEGLHFNPVIKACDFPENVNCTKPLPECPPEGVSFHPYPGNCTLYVICAEGSPFVWECAPGTCFDENELKCLSNVTLISDAPNQVLI